MAEMEVKGGKGSPRVDLTPMVDLGFLLITFFMFTTTMSKPKAMQIQMPFKDEKMEEQDKSKVKESTAMTILLSKDHRVYYYYGIGSDATNPPKLEVTGFKDQGGIRDAIIAKKKEVQSLVASGALSPDDKITIMIKPADNSTTDDLIDVLDEMTINAVPIYAVVDITPVDLEFIEATENANGE
ncbi:MAG: biopolymer transporter ExbD [Sphingobacteriales bacterium]|nr:MAG: biopolymer transporter ExbD [Sphingobacteriales bacterium]